MEKRDPRKIVSSYLVAYRTTPQRLQGAAQQSCLFNRRIRTKLPGLRFKQEGEVHREVREKLKKEREKQKA